MIKEGTNIFISFSFDSSEQKKKDLEKLLETKSYIANYSEKVDMTEYSDETIWNKLKGKISGSSVMLVIYSEDLEKGKGGKAQKIKDITNPNDNDFRKQGWVYKEIRCALRDGANNAINGILVIMPDDIYKKIYSNSTCPEKGTETLYLDKTRYPEILLNNYGNKTPNNRHTDCKCCFDILEDSYIPIVRESSFMKNTKRYIDLVKEKRSDVNKYNIKKQTD